MIRRSIRIILITDQGSLYKTCCSTARGLVESGLKMVPNPERTSTLPWHHPPDISHGHSPLPPSRRRFTNTFISTKITDLCQHRGRLVRLLCYVFRCVVICCVLSPNSLIFQKWAICLVMAEHPTTIFNMKINPYDTSGPCFLFGFPPLAERTLSWAHL